MLDKIYCPEEQRERADKALRLNGFTGIDNLPLTSAKAKPKVRITRLNHGIKGPKLQSASSKQSFQEHLASCEICRTVYTEQTARANKVLRLNS